MVMKVETHITGLQGGNAIFNAYFQPAASPENNAAAVLASNRVYNALTNVLGELSSSVSYVINPAVTVYNPATGAVTGVATGPGGTRTGTAGEPQVPSATAICCVWETGVAGPRRMIRGRTFLSGWKYTAVGTGGAPSAAVLAVAQDFADAMNDAGTTDLVFGVWHRPVAGAGGAFHGCSSQRVSQKFAVLKSRRD
jgi:hypothetical protein